MTLTEPALLEVRTDALLQITHAIETAATLDELLLLALVEFTRMLAVPRGGVMLLDETGTLGIVACEFPPRVRTPPPLAVADAPSLQQLIAVRQPVQIADIAEQDSAHLTSLGVLIQAEQIRSLLMLPLVSQDRVIGVLVLATEDEPRPFAASQVAMARVMAGQLAAGIASFRITEAALRRSHELVTLNKIAETVTSTLDPHEVYRLVQQKLNEHFNVEAGSLLMIDEEGDDLIFVMTLEGSEEQAAGLRVPRGRGIAWLVAESCRYEIVLDAATDPRIYRKVGETLRMPTRSLLTAPMVVKGRSIGVIQLLNKRDGIFTDEDGQRLTRMATTIGVAIENARLFQQVTIVRDRFEAILNSTTDGILMADMRGTLVTANPMAAHILRLSREQLVGRRLDQLLAELHAHAREQIIPGWAADAPGGLQVVELELTGWHPQFRFVRQLTLPVRDVLGAVIGQLILFQDITQAKELEELREDYVGMLVHDLRAPLTAIMNGVLMIKRGLGGPVTEQQNELLAIAHQGSQTMLEMVNTLLDIAKMEQNRMTLDLELVSPYVLVDEAQGRLHGSLQKQNVVARSDLAPGLPELEVDRDKIVRLLQNLLDNAIKFSPTGAQIALGGFLLTNDAPAAHPLTLPPLPTGCWLVLWVRDQGPGIPQQYHDRIFEKFGQVRGRTIRGTGLGLTFCKLAVEAHGGTIWLDSSESQGSTFAFALPLERSRPLLVG